MKLKKKKQDLNYVSHGTSMHIDAVAVLYYSYTYDIMS